MPHPHPPAARRLPPQPSLEQLRKQAKDLLAEYVAGDPAAIAEVHRFERHPHPAAFALHDAQRVLARAYGYESWAKLKAFVNGASVARLAEAVQAGDVADGKRVIACFAATDNLVKGGAGQAIQSMNLMLGLDERLTLEDTGGWP